MLAGNVTKKNKKYVSLHTRRKFTHFEHFTLSESWNLTLSLKMILMLSLNLLIGVDDSEGAEQGILNS